MIPPQMLAGGAALALLAGFFGGWTVRDWRADADTLSAVEKAEKRAEAARDQGLEQGAAYAQFSAGSQQQAGHDRNTIRETYREVHVPSDCAVVPAAVGVLENAVRRANSGVASEPGSAVPATPDATGSIDRSGPAGMGN